MTNVRRKTYRNIGRIEKVRGRIGRMVTINNGGRRRRLNGMLRRFGGCNSRRSHRRKRDCRSENWGFMSNGKGGWNLKRVGFLFWFYGYKQKRGKLIRVESTSVVDAESNCVTPRGNFLLSCYVYIFTRVQKISLIQ